MIGSMSCAACCQLIRSPTTVAQREMIVADLQAAQFRFLELTAVEDTLDEVEVVPKGAVEVVLTWHGVECSIARGPMAVEVG